MKASRIGRLDGAIIAGLERSHTFAAGIKVVVELRGHSSSRDAMPARDAGVTNGSQSEFKIRRPARSHELQAAVCASYKITF